MLVELQLSKIIALASRLMKWIGKERCFQSSVICFQHNSHTYFFPPMEKSFRSCSGPPLSNFKTHLWPHESKGLPACGPNAKTWCVFPSQRVQISRQHLLQLMSDATGPLRCTRWAQLNELIYLVCCYHLEKTSCPPAHTTHTPHLALSRTRDSQRFGCHWSLNLGCRCLPSAESPSLHCPHRGPCIFYNWYKADTGLHVAFNHLATQQSPV